MMMIISTVTIIVMIVTKAVTFDLRAQQMAATSEQIISKRVEKEKEHMGSTEHRHRGGSGGLTTAFLFSLGQLGQAGGSSKIGKY